MKSAFLLSATCIALMCQSAAAACKNVINSFNLTCDDYIRDRPSFTCEILEDRLKYDCTGCECTSDHKMCPQTCALHDCNFWMEEGHTSCADLEGGGCNCTGCSMCNQTIVPVPVIDADWFWEKDRVCMNISNQSNYAYISNDRDGQPRAWDIFIPFQSQDPPSERCQSQCQRNPICGGFQFDIQTTNCTYLISTVNVGKSFDPASVCYTYKPRNPGFVPPPYETTSTRAPTTPDHDKCPSLHGLLSCDELIRRYGHDQFSCYLLEQHGYNCTGCECPRPQAPKTCENPHGCIFRSCDYQLDNFYNKTCASLEQLGCNCTGCACTGHGPTTTPAEVSNWRAQNNDNCLRSPDDPDFNKTIMIRIDEFKKGFIISESVLDCMELCGKHPECGGFSRNEIDLKCVFYKNPEWHFLDETPDEFKCFIDPDRVNLNTTSTWGPVPPSTFPTTAQGTTATPAGTPAISTQAVQNATTPAPSAITTTNPRTSTATTSAPTSPATTTTMTSATTTTATTSTTTTTTTSTTTTTTTTTTTSTTTTPTTITTTTTTTATTSSSTVPGDNNNVAAPGANSVAIGLGIGIPVVLILGILVFLYIRRRNGGKSVNYSSFVSKRTSQHVEGEETQSLRGRTNSETFQYQPPENFAL